MNGGARLPREPTPVVAILHYYRAAMNRLSSLNCLNRLNRLSCLNRLNRWS